MLPRRDVQFIGDVMEYTREQALTIVNFLDDFGIGSFVEGFKDGLCDYRDGLEGVRRHEKCTRKRQQKCTSQSGHF